MHIFNNKSVIAITLIPWRSGMLLVWDATCLDTFAPSHLSRATSEAGAVAANTRSKHEKYLTSINVTSYTRGYGDGRSLWARNLLVPERTRLPPQAGDWRKQIIQLSATIPVCRSATGNVATVMGSMGSTTSPFDFFP